MAFASRLNRARRSSVFGQLRREDLERDLAVQFGVLGQIDFAHASGADLLQHLVVGELAADHLLSSVTTSMWFCTGLGGFRR